MIEEWFAAIRAGNRERVEEVLKTRPDLANTENGDGLTALGFAAHYGHASIVKLLLEHGAEVRAISHSRIPFIPANTALHAAIAGERSLETIRLLLKHSADPNRRDSNGHTCLHSAAFHDDQTELLEALLHHGAELDALTDRGETALAMALAKGNSRTAEYLRQRGAVQ